MEKENSCLRTKCQNQKQLLCFLICCTQLSYRWQQPDTTHMYIWEAWLSFHNKNPWKRSLLLSSLLMGIKPHVLLLYCATKRGGIWILWIYSNMQCRVSPAEVNDEWRGGRENKNDGGSLLVSCLSGELDLSSVTELVFTSLLESTVTEGDKQTKLNKKQHYICLQLSHDQNTCPTHV